MFQQHVESITPVVTRIEKLLTVVLHPVHVCNCSESTVWSTGDRCRTGTNALEQPR
jgi:hypothetical protein